METPQKRERMKYQLAKSARIAKLPDRIHFWLWIALFVAGFLLILNRPS
jgi:hypothetical protein